MLHPNYVGTSKSAMTTVGKSVMTTAIDMTIHRIARKKI